MEDQKEDGEGLPCMVACVEDPLGLLGKISFKMNYPGCCLKSVSSLFASFGHLGNSRFTQALGGMFRKMDESGLSIPCVWQGLVRTLQTSAESRRDVGWFLSASGVQLESTTLAIRIRSFGKELNTPFRTSKRAREDKSGHIGES